MQAPRFDFGAMSPYSWFAAERIDAMLPDARWRPVFAALTLMRLAFTEGADLGDPAAVAEAARRTTLDPDMVAEAIRQQDVKDDVRAITAEATALGVIGVPTIVVGGDLFWADDRLADAARHAGGAGRPGDAETRGEPAAW